MSHATRIISDVLLVIALATPAFAQHSILARAELEQVMTADGVNEFTSTLFEGYEQPLATNSVHIYLLMVRSLHPSGVETSVRVQLFVPDVPPERIRGAYLFAPGSTGLINPCRASREHEAGIRWGLYRAHVLAFSGRGFIGILPDYQGFEDWDLIQPYFHAASEARVVQDALRATDEFLRDTIPGGLSETTRVAAGFSQGGHAAFAAADRNRELPPSLRLHGIIGYGPTTEIEPLLLQYPEVAPLIVESFSHIYGQARFDPFAILRSKWAQTLDYDTTRQCVGGIQAYYPASAEDLYTNEFLSALRGGSLGHSFPEIAEIFTENDTGLTGHGLPALVLQGTNDIVVDRTVQDEFVIALRERGSAVKYYVYEGSRHDTRQVAFPKVTEWIDGLRSGPAPIP